MKKLLVLVALIGSTAICSTTRAQVTPPPGAGDKDLRDTDAKRRSVEMERIDREARKKGGLPETSAAKTEEDRLAVKFDEIKTDYEQIQLSQDSVIKAYKSGQKIDYAEISKSALEINKSAIRLHSNLFPELEKTDAENKKKKDDKTEKETKPDKSVRDLIVELDNAIGSFATSPMFQNLRVVDAKVSEKTKLDLDKIVELSALLDAGARKMVAGEK